MKKELFVIDDEPKICQALTAFFEERGFHVVTASTAQEALEQLPTLQADTVLLDVRLPDGSGLDVLSRLKARCPNLRVVVISGFGDEGTIQEALQRGASGYLSKPFDFSQCFYTAMGIETVEVATLVPQPEALAKVPVAVARRYRLLPVRLSGETLEVALADPLDVQQLDELQALLGCGLKALAVVDGDIAAAIERCYGVGAGVSAAPAIAAGIPRLPSRLAEPPRPEAPATSGIIRLINELIEQAHASRATDVHIGLGPSGPWIRQRVDGIL